MQYVLSRFDKWNSYPGSTGTGASVEQTGDLFAPNHTPASRCSYWLEDIEHQGLAPFHANATDYPVFRNVKDFGAKGDGVADDTTAINNAISSGGRCAPFSCESSTTSPAVVYFPAGTFRLTGPLIDYYETQLIGNPNCLPVLKPSANFTLSPGAVGIIDGSPYGANGLGFQATNTFYRQIRNFILDMTDVPSTSAITGIHWPTAQSTSLQNVVFHMSDAPGTQHRGMLIEDGKPPFFHPPPIKAPRNIESFELGEYWYTHEYVVDHGCTTQYNSPSPVGMKGPPEHHALYQYQFAETLDSFVGLAQTESSYSQPNPNATMPFPPVTSLNDPNITASSDGQSGNSANGWGLRILDSENILIYGLSLYSFFNNYNTSCSDSGNNETCQTMIFDIEGSVSNINVYNLNTVGSTSLINQNGKSLASYADNVNVYPDTIALFKTD